MIRAEPKAKERLMFKLTANKRAQRNLSIISSKKSRQGKGRIENRVNNNKMRKRKAIGMTTTSKGRK